MKNAHRSTMENTKNDLSTTPLIMRVIYLVHNRLYLAIFLHDHLDLGKKRKRKEDVMKSQWKKKKKRKRIKTTRRNRCEQEKKDEMANLKYLKNC